MSLFIPPHATIEGAWTEALGQVNSLQGGTAGRLVLVVNEPDRGDNASVRALIDAELVRKGKDSVDTVASTLFPDALYAPPAHVWSPDLSPRKVRELDEAADGLFHAYGAALPGITRFSRNSRGTYFGRFMSWPGKVAGGVNQLKERIDAIRGFRNFHAADLAVAGEAELDLPGLQMYASTDRRYRDFPCLSHVTLTLSDDHLSMTALYRNWHLISRGYGNLVGLARMQRFLAQQTGTAIGELMVVAGEANAERNIYGGRLLVDKLVGSTRSAYARNGVAEAVAVA